MVNCHPPFCTASAAIRCRWPSCFSFGRSMSRLSRAWTNHLVVLRAFGLNFRHLPHVCWVVCPRFLLSSRLGKGLQTRLLRICCGPMDVPTRLAWRGGVPEVSEAALLSRRMSASGCLTIAWLRISPLAYTSAYRLRGRLAEQVPLFDGRLGTSPVKLTNHFPEANPTVTTTLGRQLTVFAADPTNLRWLVRRTSPVHGGWCFV